MTNYELQLTGARYIFSRRPSPKECEWLAAAYGQDDSYRVVKAGPDSYASCDAVLARVATNIRYTQSKARA